LLLLANLEERSTHRESDYFLEVGDNVLEGNSLVDKAIRDMFALFWKVMVLPAKETLPCF